MFTQSAWRLHSYVPSLHSSMSAGKEIKKRVSYFFGISLINEKRKKGEFFSRSEGLFSSFLLVKEN